MELRQIEYFLEVARSGSVTSAAKHFHIAQPSVSQALRRLEREIGTPLFERVSRGMRLTSAGEAMIVPAQRMLRERDDARAAVNAVIGLAGGHVDLIGLPSLVVDPVASLVGTFVRKHPRVRINIGKTTDPLEVADAVDQGVVDVGLTDYMQSDRPGLAHHVLGSQCFLVAMPAGLRAHDGPMCLEELAELHFVVGPSGGSSRMRLKGMLASIGQTPQIVVETMTTDAVVPLVVAGAGSALLPETVAWTARTLGADVFEVKQNTVRQVVLVHRAEVRSPLTSAFIALVLGRE